MKSDWKATLITFTGRTDYPFRVHGQNNLTNDLFIWDVPDVTSNPRYDIDSAQWAFHPDVTRRYTAEMED